MPTAQVIPGSGHRGKGGILALGSGASLPDAGAVAGGETPGVRTSTPAPSCQEEDLCSRLRTQNRSLAGGGPFGNGHEARAVATLRR